MMQVQSISRTRILLLINLVLLIVLLYQPALKAFFVADDYYLWQTVKNLSFSESFKLFIPEFLGGISAVKHTGHNAPLSAWIIWFNTVPLQMNAFATHIVSLILHLLVISLVGIFSYQVSQNQKVAMLSMLIFGTFPYISEAGYFMSAVLFLVGTMFYYLTLISLLEYLKSNRKIWIIIHLLCFSLAIFSAEISFTLPITILVLLIYWQNTSPLKVIIQHFGLFIVYPVLIIISVAHWMLSLGTTNIFVMNGRFEFLSASRLFVDYLAVFVSLIGFRIYFSRQVPQNIINKEKLFWTLLLLIGITWLPTAKLYTEQRYLYLPVSFTTVAASYLLLTINKIIHDNRLKLLVKIGLAAVLVFQSFLLYRNSWRWWQAGETACSIIIQVAQLIQKNKLDGPIYLINIPDSINGAYVHRSYFATAYEFVTSQKPPTFIFTPMTFGDAAKTSVTSPANLSLINPQGFVLFKPDRDLQGRRIINWPGIYTATEIDPQTLEVKFSDPQFIFHKNKVLVYENGIIKYLFKD